MKFVLILLVLSVYITTIRPFLLGESWQRLFKIDQKNTGSRLVGVPFDKNVQIKNKPYARSLKSVDNELRYDLDSSVSSEHDRNVNRRMNYFKRASRPYPRRRDNVQIWNQLLESLKIDDKLISRQKKNKLRNNRSKILNDNEKVSLREKQTVFNRNKTNKPVLKEKKSLRRVVDSEEQYSESISSERDFGMKYWQDLIRQERKLKKAKALAVTTPSGDVVNMTAAKEKDENKNNSLKPGLLDLRSINTGQDELPVSMQKYNPDILALNKTRMRKKPGPWGIDCGDPNQHDMPWGTCVPPMECEPELRVYRGDVACGRTHLVCCALELNVYDVYVDSDFSFYDSEVAPEYYYYYAPKGSSERKRDKERWDKERRENQRKERKKHISKIIRRVVKRINRILYKMYSNTTVQRKLRTKNLKAYIKMLKNKYKQDRLEVKEMHADEVKKLDTELFSRLEQIINMNTEFSVNETFRDILINGTISPKAAQMLSVMYPDLAPSLRSYSRRTGALLKDGDFSEDVEYGFLYD